jgi:transcriptional regulator with XRE-family HTH domain
MTLTALVGMRKAAKVTQEEAAEILGCSRDTLRRWEKGRVDLPARAIPQLASLYNRKPEDILEVLGNPPFSPEATTDNTSS